MDFTKEDLAHLRQMIGDWWPQEKYELEVTFGGGNVSSATFMNVFKRLKSKYTQVDVDSEEKLNILLKKNDLRFTLPDFSDIEKYCKDNIINDKDYEVITKTRIASSNDLSMKEYNAKFKMRKEETEIPKEKVELVLSTWGTTDKAFRLIKRWSFVDGTNPADSALQFDLSMVRSSARDKQGQYHMVKTFNEMPFTRSLPTYEIEVELKKNPGLAFPEGISAEEKKKIAVNHYLTRLVKGVGEVLRGIQQNILLIRKSEEDRVLLEYLGLTKLEQETARGRFAFRGVKPVTMLLENLDKKGVKNKANLRDGFNVTDKADGLRVHAFCDETGELFMIDMAGHVYRTGLRRQACANTLLDGEWITTDKDDAPIQQLLLFDYYMNGNRDISKKPFYAENERGDVLEDTRHSYMKKWIENWSGGDGYEITIPGYRDKKQQLLQVSMKEFFFGKKGDDSIFKAAEDCYANAMRKMYKTDGLIFTSNEKALPTAPGGAFYSQLKWKPSHDNTIDFAVIFEKNPLDASEDKIYKDAAHGEYKKLILCVGSDTNEFTVNPRIAVLDNKWPFPKEQKNVYKAVEFMPKDYSESLASTCYCKVQMDDEVDIEYVTCESGEIIQDKSIIEMRYDPSQEAGWRWIPMRVRHDKTQKYLAVKGQVGKGIVGTLNNEHVANDTWNSIYNPITLGMITSGSMSPDPEEIAAILSAKAQIQTVRYTAQFTISKNAQEYLKPMRSFHNRWIKNEVLLQPTLTGTEESSKTLIDLSVGKAGDLMKWKQIMPKFVLGIDIAEEDIIDKDNGAYSRVLDMWMRPHNDGGGKDSMPPCIFVVGDSSKRILTGEAGKNPEESRILRTLFGERDSISDHPYVNEYRGILRDGADVVSCMFAIHYFFESEKKFNGFLQNVKDTLKLNGYFVCCCFDGDEVVKLLSEKKEGDDTTVTGKVDGDVLWYIKKKYEDEQVNGSTGLIPFGVSIEAFVASIGAPYTEYLVSKDLLIEKMKSIGCSLLAPDELKELGLGASTNLFSKSFEMAKTQKMSFGLERKEFEVVRQFSFLNRWFIFKRTSDGTDVVPAEEAPAGLRPGPSGPVRLEQAASAPAQGDTFGDDAAAAIDAAAGPIVARPPEPEQIYVFAHNSVIGGKADKERRYLSLIAPFTIRTPVEYREEGETEAYPTIAHFLAAMKYRFASSKPKKATDFTVEGPIYTAGQTDVKIAQAGTEKAKNTGYYKLLDSQLAAITSLLKTPNQYKASFDEEGWIDFKDDLLRYALTERYNNDAQFKKIILAQKDANKYLLFKSQPGEPDEDRGGDFKKGRVEGENKVGKILMELAKFPW